MGRAISQGDIILTPINAMPEGRKSNNILAYGEATGHNHAVVPAAANVTVETVSVGGQLFTKVSGGDAYLIHSDLPSISAEKVEEVVETMFQRIDKGEDFHKPQRVAAGVYRLGMEQEVDPFTREIRQVID